MAMLLLNIGLFRVQTQRRSVYGSSTAPPPTASSCRSDVRNQRRHNYADRAIGTFGCTSVALPQGPYAPAAPASLIPSIVRLHDARTAKLATTIRKPGTRRCSVRR
jgi:hypothetical protein